MSEWQTMETAPKDGTWILAINNRGNYAVIIWTETAFDMGRIIPGWIHPFSDGSLSSFWNGACGSVPTHWMPFPKPPAQYLPNRHYRPDLEVAEAAS